MTMTRTLSIIGASLALASLAVTGAFAAGGKAKHNKEIDWHFNGVTGKYDPDALQRGFQVYRQVCASCHSLDLVSFRNLGQKGGPYYLEECPKGVPASVDCKNPNENPIVKAFASEYVFQDGPDDTGDMFDRPGLPSDNFPNPYPNEQVARLANNGALPPDMSLLIKARHDGANYIYSLLTGYKEAPVEVTVAPGQYYNEYYPGDMSLLLKEEYLDDHGHPAEGVKVPYGGVFAMKSPLSDGLIDYVDPETPETVSQYAKDVTEFLMWAAEPKLEQRKNLGFVTIIYLLILTGILYWSYREIWSRVEH